MATEQLKDRALFFLDRRLNELPEFVDQEGLAKQGAPYSERRRILAEMEDEREKTEIERQTLLWLRELVVNAQ